MGGRLGHFLFQTSAGFQDFPDPQPGKGFDKERVSGWKHLKREGESYKAHVQPVIQIMCKWKKHLLNEQSFLVLQMQTLECFGHSLAQRCRRWTVVRAQRTLHLWSSVQASSKFDLSKKKQIKIFLTAYRWSWTWGDQHFFSLPAKVEIISKSTNHQNSSPNSRPKSPRLKIPERRTIRTTKAASQSARTGITARVAGEKGDFSFGGA